MKTNFVIIGGGVAGLCAAIRLSELGEEPLLIEGGSYPAHKVCGEFLSPECIGHLEKWDIHPVSIPAVVLHASGRSITFQFPSHAGGMSHLQLDPALAEYALKRGVTIRTKTRVKSIEPKHKSNMPHLVHLSDGQVIEASRLIIATGRIPSHLTQPPDMIYRGFKAHFKEVGSDGNLEMFSFPGAYLGIAPVESGMFNVACLVRQECLKNDETPKIFMQQLMGKHPRLYSALSQGTNLFDDWMTASLPAFGIKSTPDWLDAYFIGDASVSIPPACGNGLSMAIIGGMLAADYAMKDEPAPFKKMWVKRCSSQMFWAKRLHQLMLNPVYGSSFIRLAVHFPSLTAKAFALTRCEG